MKDLLDFICKLSDETRQKILIELYRDLPALTVYNQETAVKVSWLIDAIETIYGG